MLMVRLFTHKQELYQKNHYWIIYPLRILYMKRVKYNLMKRLNGNIMSIYYIINQF
jgi:hypothetical protein